VIGRQSFKLLATKTLLIISTPTLILAFFFRPMPYGSRQVVNQTGKLMQIGKFNELMQWQHPHIDNVHQKQN
jgi:hypothetical protein